MTQEEWRDAYLAKAKQAMYLLEKARAKLKAFPLWKRLVFYKRFNGVRAKIVKYRNAVAYYTTLTFAVQRKIKWKRQQEKLKNETQ